MPEKHQIVFYPVGNGDTSQVVLSQGRRVLFDFCHRKSGQKKWADAMHYTRNASLLRAGVLRDGHDSAVLVCESQAASRQGFVGRRGLHCQAGPAPLEQWLRQPL